MSARNGIFGCRETATKSPQETTYARGDQKDPKPVAQIPAQTAYLLTGKHPVRGDWVGVSGPRERIIADQSSDNRSLPVYDRSAHVAAQGSNAMLGTLRKVLIPSNEDSLADAFSRLGSISFWIQLAIGSIPVFFAVYAFILGGGGVGTRRRSLLVEYLTIAGLIVLVFTTIWS